MTLNTDTSGPGPSTFQNTKLESIASDGIVWRHVNLEGTKEFTTFQKLQQAVRRVVPPEKQEATLEMIAKLDCENPAGELCDASTDLPPSDTKRQIEAATTGWSAHLAAFLSVLSEAVCDEDAGPALVKGFMFNYSMKVTLRDIPSAPDLRDKVSKINCPAVHSYSARLARE
jgi:hypothetical protein